SRKSEWYWKARGPLLKAQTLLRKTLDEERSPQNLLALGSLLVLMEAYDDAKPLLYEAIELDPELELAHATLAFADLRTADNRDAVRAFSEALRRDPDNLEFQIGLSESYLRIEQLDEAERGYR